MPIPEGSERPKVIVSKELLWNQLFSMLGVDIGATLVDVEWHGKNGTVTFYFEPPK